MLSIGKLAAGQAGYYLEQANGSVTRAGAVSSGVEDYYLSGPEASGAWDGAGAAALGLCGTVGAAQLERVLAGEHPLTAEPLGRVLPRRVPGFDLTFSAPKSVSVLFGVGDDDVRAAIRDAHDAAVRDAMGYVERVTAVTRRGPGGVRAIAGNGLVAAAFRHRTSRAGDPQLHTHVLVANLTLGADGQWSTLDGRRIYAYAKTAGYLYELRLRTELTRVLGVEWGPIRNGIADIAGVSPQLLRAFSRRRADIEAELERRGASSARAAEVAALETRRRKDYAVTPEQLAPEWRERAASLGLSAVRIGELFARSVGERLSPGLEHAIADALAAPDGLTRQHSTFTRRDVIQAICESLPAGARVTIAEVEQAANRFLGSDRAVALLVGERGSDQPGVLRRRDGRVVPLVRGDVVYSTPELLALERRILEHATSTRDEGVGVARSFVVERALQRRPSISAEQEAMVRRLTLDGDGVAIVVGQAGAGKTFALAAAAEAWQASGNVLVGAAIARRAARHLEDETGITSTSVTALLAELDADRRGLPRRAVLVIDEAGMLPTRELARLVDHAARARAKLVLVGDHRQLAAIEAGGAFHALGTRLPVIELLENRRQSERWERDALELLRGGQGGEALERYGEHGRVVQAEDADAVRQRLVADWWAARDPDRSVMIAYRRVDVRELNGRARALMRAGGALGTAELQIGDAGFAAGDRVVLRRNDRALDVCNGDRGTVTDVDPARRVVDVELRGQPVRLDARYLDAATRHGAALQHAYAITGHVAQGLTFRQTFVLGSEHISREWGYSALSRGRESNRLYSVAARSDDRDEYAPPEPDRRDPRERLAEALERSDAQTLATDTDGWQRLVEQLQAAIAEVDAASRAHGAAAATRRSSELDSPGRLRPRARRRHDEELARAREAEDRAGGRVAATRARESTLRAQLDQERPTLHAVQPSGLTEGEPRTQRLERLGLTQPERVLRRARDTSRGIER